MNKWMEIQVQVDAVDEEKSPYCGSRDVSYKETLFAKDSTAGYADIWCNDCRRAYHISRGEFRNPKGKDLVIPRGLEYKQ